ncbi:MAG: N-acetylneuraminate synthase family protein [Vicinamibacteria bacterium]
MKTIDIGGLPVGPEHPPVFFAEIGSFFNGDVELARRMIRAVIEAHRKVPRQPMILKTEILDDPEICLPGEFEETYASKGGGVRKENYRALIERKVLPLESYRELFAIPREAGVPFVVSVYDFRAADFSRENGAAALKIASSNVTHVPLIRHVARLGLPMVIDTGRTTIAEVHRAVDVARAAGCSDIVLQHSPDGHPALPEAHNLRILQTLAQAFNLPTGLSDHYVGVEMLYVAIALGASVLEKGVAFDPEDLDQDISHTMSTRDLPGVLERTNDCWLALGATARDPAYKVKGVIGSSQRQGLVARRALVPGDAINLETVRFAFPRMGIPVESWDLVDGWRLAESVAAGRPIEWRHVRPSPV